MMKNVKFPLPKKYWIYMSLIALFAVLVFVNVFATNGLNNEKELWEFNQKDWCYFLVFLLTEIIIGIFMFFFAVKAGRISISNQKHIAHYY